VRTESADFASAGGYKEGAQPIPYPHFAAHVLVEGSLVSSIYEQANGKGKKARIPGTNFTD